MSRLHIHKEMSGLLVVISGPSGVGKTTITKKILDSIKDVVYSVSVTTRKPRSDEKNGKDYIFVSREKFKKMIERGEFLEYAHVHGNYYGTPARFIKENLKKNRVVLLDIDVQGARKIKRIFKGNSILIFILPPSWEILKERIICRGNNTVKDIRMRLKNAEKEFSYISDYDYFVVNETLDIAVKKIKEIIHLNSKNKLVRRE